MKAPTILLVGLLAMVTGTSAAQPSLPDEVMINGVEFIRIPEGQFWYSVAIDDSARRDKGSGGYRQVRVWLDEYYIGKYEARAREFVRFMNSPAANSDLIGDDEIRVPEKSGCAVHFEPGAGYRERFAVADLPATAVSWDLADAFSRWMGFRLPTEAEWQKAARGSDQRIWPWGNEYPDDTYANYGFAANCVPAPVTAYPKGRSPYGVYNMAGNVAEWTRDWSNSTFDHGLVDGVRNPMPPPKPSLDTGRYVFPRVAKGGRWGSIAGAVAVAVRHGGEPDAFNDSSGLRFVVDSAVVRVHLERGTARVLVQ